MARGENLSNGLTPEMKNRVERMASRTWDEIGGDVLNCLAEQNLPQIMKRDEVIETVCDADYMKTYGNDPEAYDLWKRIPSYKKKMDVIKGAFPYKTYGW